MAFPSVLVPSLTRVLGLISVCRYFCSGHARPLVSGGREKKSRILYTITTCNQICHMTFSSLNSKGTHTDTCAEREKHQHAHIAYIKNAPVVSHSRHSDRNWCTATHTPVRCLPESQSLFPQTILQCFLQSPNWLYPNPVHRPESETIKNSIYIPAVSA